MTASLPSKEAVVGLDYVGLPLAAAFSKVLPTIGFDINQNRIAELKEGLDRNGEMSQADLAGAPLELDPYYLTHKAQEIDYHPEVILAGRRIGDSMGRYVAGETIRLLIQSGKVVRGAKTLVLCGAFKENVPDVRNSALRTKKDLLYWSL